jgi:hypothetical protein
MIESAILVIAIVTQNQAPLRVAPHDSAPQQAVLWQGDSLEVRGQSTDFVQVYDHRRERAGYVKAAQVRFTALAPAAAPDLLAVVRFLRDTPGAEALGISYAAAYLKAAPSDALTAEPFEAIGVMADRLAHRASLKQSQQGATTLAAHLEVVSEYGVVVRSLERNGAISLCYDGEMFRRVLAMRSATSAQRATSALALTGNDCLDPLMGATARYERLRWDAAVLDSVPSVGLPSELRARVKARAASVWADLAFAQAERGEAARSAADRSLRELASVDKSDLGDQDQAEYADAALRVGASRWAAEPTVKRSGRLTVQTTPGTPGETCILLLDTDHNAQNPLVRRCTFAVVWTASATSNASGTVLALAVQPLAGWRELWLFRKSGAGWVISAIPPGSSAPGVGYVEFAGWVPGTDRMLAAREVLVDGNLRRRFEVMNVRSLVVERRSQAPELLRAFKQWQDPNWLQGTIAMR